MIMKIQDTCLLSSYGTCALDQVTEQLKIHFSFWQYIGKSIFDSTDKSQSMLQILGCYESNEFDRA